MWLYRVGYPTQHQTNCGVSDRSFFLYFVRIVLKVGIREEATLRNLEVSAGPGPVTLFPFQSKQGFAKAAWVCPSQ